MMPSAEPAIGMASHFATIFRRHFAIFRRLKMAAKFCYCSGSDLTLLRLLKII
jgi:hypothetical protein